MYEPEEYKMTKFRLGIACVAAIVVVAVVVVSSSNRSKSGIMPEVLVVQTPAEVRIKSVERKAEPVSEGEEAAVSGAVAIVCGEDAATAERYEARNDALRSIARKELTLALRVEL